MTTDEKPEINPPERNLSVPAPMFSKPSARAQISLLKNNLEKGAVNWERIVELYKFKNKDEAREWFKKKMKVI